MHKTYSYRRFHIFGSIVLIATVCFCVVLGKYFLAEAIGAENLLYALIAAIVGLFLTLAGLWILVEMFLRLIQAKKVTTQNESLTIKNLSSIKTIMWEDITEFGTHRIGFGRNRHRRYYVKTEESGDNKIDLCTHRLENLKELMDTVFLKATNAKFIIAENIARIPFTKQIQLLPWDRRDPLC